MAFTAKSSTGWRVRLGIIALMSLFMSSFFFYDGFVGYPESQKLFEKVQAFTESDGVKELNEAGKLEAWNAYALKNQLPTENKLKKLMDLKKTESQMSTQKTLGFVLLPISLLFCFSWVRWLGRTVSCDDDGVRNSQGESVAWDAIVKFDKSKWVKGIAFLVYKDGEDERRFLIDDFKYQREPMDGIVRAIEANLEADQIVGDITEVERDKRRAAKKAGGKTDGKAADGKTGDEASQDDADTGDTNRDAAGDSGDGSDDEAGQSSETASEVEDPVSADA